MYRYNNTLIGIWLWVLVYIIILPHPGQWKASVNHQPTENIFKIQTFVFMHIKITRPLLYFSYVFFWIALTNKYLFHCMQPKWGCWEKLKAKRDIT